MVKQAEHIITGDQKDSIEPVAQYKNIGQSSQIQRRYENKTVEKPLFKIRPSWWNFFWYLVFCWLIIPLIVVLWKRAGLLLSVYKDKIVLERGVLSKHITQVLISDIRSIDTRQRFIQRIFRIGDVIIGTAGMSDYEIEARGLSNPRGIVDFILRQRQSLKETNE